MFPSTWNIDLNWPTPLLLARRSLSALPNDVISRIECEGQLHSELFGRRHSTLQSHGLFALAKRLFYMLPRHKWVGLISDQIKLVDIYCRLECVFSNIAERLIRTDKPVAEIFAETSVYFSEIVRFTKLAAESRPSEVVNLLNELYRTLDAVIFRHHVYKVFGAICLCIYVRPCERLTCTQKMTVIVSSRNWIRNPQVKPAISEWRWRDWSRVGAMQNGEWGSGGIAARKCSKYIVEICIFVQLQTTFSRLLEFDHSVFGNHWQL